MADLNLEQLRKQAKARVRADRAHGREIRLSEAQLELARAHGFASWPRLKAYVERLDAEQPFHTDIDYYEGRADGIASVNGVGVAEARRDLAQRHGFATWAALRRHVAALRDGRELPSPFVLAYRCVDAPDALASEAAALAVTLAAGPTRAFGLSKRLLNTSFETDLAASLEQEGAAQSLATASHDLVEGMAAFREKRNAEFTGT